MKPGHIVICLLPWVVKKFKNHKSAKFWNNKEAHWGILTLGKVLFPVPLQCFSLPLNVLKSKYSKLTYLNCQYKWTINVMSFHMWDSEG